MHHAAWKEFVDGAKFISLTAVPAFGRASAGARHEARRAVALASAAPRVCFR